MCYIRVGVIFALLLAQVTISVPAGALSQSGIVISHIIAGETNYPNAEFVALYNNASFDIDITGYCLWSNSYAVAPIACVQAEANTRVYIRAHNYLTIASTVFAVNHAYTSDTTYAAANRITMSGDSVYIKDTQDVEVDRVTWGSGKLTTGGTLQRKEAVDGSGILLDTNTTDLTDFVSLAAPVYPPNASYDVVMIVDVCPNLADTQQEMPAGYLADQQGNCQPDSCLNIDSLQVSVPEGYDSDASGICMQHDECSNRDGIQATVPDNMIRGVSNECVWSLPLLELTELLPNAPGSDTGNEFIEIYNPNDFAVDLSLYSLKIGVNGEKSVAFPNGMTIAAGEYRSFNDQQLKFTLVNSMSRVVLMGVDEIIYGDSGIYDSPPDGQSWSFISGVWQYTNRPTQGSSNMAMLLTNEISDTKGVPAPCPAGKYRNPLTNRCRIVEADAAMLATCDADQYRNPDTGRCRKIAITAVALCKEGQYRSEETNRCRNIVAASTQKPCKDNQYRSEETNRCRNVAATSIPASAFAVEPVEDSAVAFIGWWALGGVALLGAGYGVWEWRYEINKSFSRIVSRFSGRR